MTFQKFCNTNGGFMLLDVLVAFAITALSISWLFGMAHEARSIYARAKNIQEDLLVFENELFSSSSKKYGNDFIETSYYSSSTPISFSKVSRKANLQDLETLSGTPICSVHYGSGVVPQFRRITLPVDPGLPLTDLQVRNGIAYVSSDSSIMADPDIFIFNIHGAEPVMLSSVNTGPGISSVSLVGNRIYAAAASTAYQIHVLKIENPDSMLLERKIQLESVSGSTTLPYATKIFYKHPYLYLGTEKWGGAEFMIYDAFTLSKVGEFEVGSEINDIYVAENIAYIASASDQLSILDVGDVHNIVSVSLVKPSGWRRQEGKIIYLFEKVIGLGRTSGGYNIVSDHEFFEWVDTTPVIDGAYSFDVPFGVYGILRNRKHTFLAARQPQKEFQIVDSDHNVSSYHLPIQPQKMTCDADKIYILANGSNTIYEITFH